MVKRIVFWTVGIICSILGLILVAAGLLVAIRGPHTNEQFLLSASVFPFGVLLLEVGLAVCWLRWVQARHLTTRAVVLPPWWATAPVFVLLVLAGWGLIQVGWWWAFLFVGTLAVIAPVVLVARLGLPGTQRPRWSRILPAYVWGALVAPIVAITLQILLAGLAVIAAAVGLSAGLQGQASNLNSLQAIARHLQGRTITDEQTAALLRLVFAQPLVLAIAGFILVFAGPATEELLKVGGAIFFSRTRPTDTPHDSHLQVFLLGLASGLGFATTENIFYAAQNGADGWKFAILQRAITPLMHGTATALFALGWSYQRRDPASRSLVKGALAAMGLHMTWNYCGGLLAIGGLYAEMRGMIAGLSVALILLSLFCLVALMVGAIVTLLRLRRRLLQEATAGQTASWVGQEPILTVS